MNDIKINKTSKVILNSKTFGKGIANVPNLRFPYFDYKWTHTTLSKISSFRKTHRVATKRCYVSTENILQNFQGIECFTTDEIVTGDGFNCDDILMGNIRPYLKKVCLVNFDGVCNSDVLIFKSETVNPHFLHCVLANDTFINYVMSSIKGSKMPRGDKRHIMRYFLSIPNYEEQAKIATFIDLLDQRIDTQSKIIEDLDSQMKWIRCNIFSDNFNQARNKLSDYLFDYAEKNENNLYLPVAVGKYGIRRREDIYSKELASDYSKNKVIHQNTLIIGMGSTQIDIGILLDNETFCVSPAYTTYKIKNINALYLNELLIFLNSLLSKKYMIISARQGKSVNKEELLAHKIYVHTDEIQIKIANLFNLLLAKIQKEKDILELYKKQKAYLLKNMFI